MPYFVALLPMLAFVGLVGAVVAGARRHVQTAVGFGILGTGSVFLALALYYGAS